MKKLLLTNKDLLKLIVKEHDNKVVYETIKGMPRRSIKGLLLENIKIEDTNSEENIADAVESSGLAAIAEFQPDILSYVLKNASKEVILKSLNELSKKQEKAEFFLRIIKNLTRSQLNAFVDHVFDTHPRTSGLTIAAKFNQPEILKVLLEKVDKDSLLHSLFFIVIASEHKDIYLKILNAMSTDQIDYYLQASPQLPIHNSLRWIGLTATARFQDSEVIDIMLNKASKKGLAEAIDMAGQVEDEAKYLYVKTGLGELMEFASYQTQCRVLAESDVFFINQILDRPTSNTGENAGNYLNKNTKLSAVQKTVLQKRYNEIFRFCSRPEDYLKNPSQIKPFLRFVKRELDYNMPKRPVFVLPTDYKGEQTTTAGKKSKNKIFPAVTSNEETPLPQVLHEERVKMYQKSHPAETKIYKDNLKKYNTHLKKWLKIIDVSLKIISDDDKNKDILLAYAVRLSGMLREPEQALQYSLRIKNPLSIDSKDNLVISELLLLRQNIQKKNKLSTPKLNIHALFHAYHALSQGNENAAQVNPYLKAAILNENKGTIEEEKFSFHEFDEENYLRACKKLFDELIDEALSKVNKACKSPAEKLAARKLLDDIRITMEPSKDITDFIAKNVKNSAKKSFIQSLKQVNETAEIFSALKNETKLEIQETKPAKLPLRQIVDYFINQIGFTNHNSNDILKAFVANMRGLSQFESTENTKVMHQLISQYIQKEPKDEKLLRSLQELEKDVRPYIFVSLSDLINHVAQIAEKNPDVSEELKREVESVTIQLNELAAEPTGKNLENMAWIVEKIKLRFPRDRPPHLDTALQYLEDGIADKLEKIETENLANLNSPSSGYQGL